MSNVSNVTEKKRLLTGYSGGVLLLILAGTVAAFVGRNIFGPLLPAIIADLGIQSSEAGLALSVMWVAIALTQYPGGMLADNLSYKTVLVGAMLFLSAGFVLLSGVSTYPGFLVALVVMGLGAGLFTPSSYAQLADLFERRRGQAFGLYTASIDVGTALAGALATVVLAVTTVQVATVVIESSWQISFVPVAFVLAAVAVGMHTYHEGSYDLGITASSIDVRGMLARLLSDPHIRMCIAAYVLYSMVFQGVLGFLPAYLQFGKGFSSTFANNVFVGFFLVGACVRIIAGYLGDRFTHLTVAITSAVCGMAGLAVLYVAQSFVPVLLGLGILALGLMGFPPVMNAYLMDFFPNASMGGDYGGTRTLLIFLGSVGPTYIGFIAERFTYNVAFAALLPLFLGAAAILYRLRQF